MAKYNEKSKNKLVNKFNGFELCSTFSASDAFLPRLLAIRGIFSGSS